MTTWAQLLADLRNVLQDTGENPRWDDDLLALYTADAIRDYSNYFPRRLDRVELASSGNGYQIPADFVEDIQVEAPVDTYLERRLPRPGTKYLTLKTRPYYYFIEGGSLYLSGSLLDGEGVFLTYFATHPVPADGAEVAFELTVPDRDLELIRLYVQASVHGQMRSKTSRLDRFDPGSGRRDDNPLRPETTNLADEYYRKVIERFGGGSIKLYRSGRYR